MRDEFVERGNLVGSVISFFSPFLSVLPIKGNGYRTISMEVLRPWGCSRPAATTISKKDTMISDDQREHLHTWITVRRVRDTMGRTRVQEWMASISEYLTFRKSLQSFFDEHLKSYCQGKCFDTRRSACCGKDSIIVHFADIAINVLLSADEEIDPILEALTTEPLGFSCVYLGPKGCLWKLTPIVCAMFLCDGLIDVRIKGNRELEETWRRLQEQRKTFTWPDHPVLFDEIEKRFLALGLPSPLMHYHFSPGLLRVKRNAGLITT